MISTKGRYAIRVMIDLAENDRGRLIPLKEIAERQEISKKYLEIIMKDMVTGGLVAGASGKGGGYGGIPAGRDPGADGGHDVPGGMPGGGGQHLSPESGLPHASPVGGIQPAVP